MVSLDEGGRSKLAVFSQVFFKSPIANFALVLFANTRFNSCVKLENTEISCDTFVSHSDDGRRICFLNTTTVQSLVLCGV